MGELTTLPRPPSWMGRGIPLPHFPLDAFGVSVRFVPVPFFHIAEVATLLRGCCAACAQKFLHALEIDQGYLARTPTGTGVPQILIVKIKKSGIKFSICTPITSELVGISS